MESQAAHNLTLRILSHWDLPPTTERIRTWTDLLADLDEGRAGTAFAKARALEHMTPAVFAKQYKALKPAPPVWEPAPSTGEEISFTEHVRRLNHQAARGHLDAIEELQRWHDANQLGRLPQAWSAALGQ